MVVNESPTKFPPLCLLGDNEKYPYCTFSCLLTPLNGYYIVAKVGDASGIGGCE